MPKTRNHKSNSSAKLLNKWQIRLAANAVDRGGVIAYPTEAIYGLGCSPWDWSAVEKLLFLKRRPMSKGLIVVAADVSQLDSLVNFAKVESIQPILQTWPGHVSWILPARKDTPAWLTGEHAGLAVRVTAHPLVRHLCSLSGPLVSTSANLANTRPALTVMDVRKYFRDSLDFILPGSLGEETNSSEIRHASSLTVLRSGKL